LSVPIRTIEAVYLDQKRTWTAAANFGLEFHQDKSGTNINVGDLGTVEWGVGRTFYKKVSGPIPMIMNVGLAGYSQFKVTGDSGSASARRRSLSPASG
jgi:hypothetical protein